LDLKRGKFKDGKENVIIRVSTLYSILIFILLRVERPRLSINLPPTYYAKVKGRVELYIYSSSEPS